MTCPHGVNESWHCEACDGPPLERYTTREALPAPWRELLEAERDQARARIAELEAERLLVRDEARALRQTLAEQGAALAHNVKRVGQLTAEAKLLVEERDALRVERDHAVVADRLLALLDVEPSNQMRILLDEAIRYGILLEWAIEWGAALLAHVQAERDQAREWGASVLDAARGIETNRCHAAHERDEARAQHDATLTAFREYEAEAVQRERRLREERDEARDNGERFRQSMYAVEEAHSEMRAERDALRAEVERLRAHLVKLVDDVSWVGEGVDPSYFADMRETAREAEEALHALGRDPDPPPPPSSSPGGASDRPDGTPGASSTEASPSEEAGSPSQGGDHEARCAVCDEGGLPAGSVACSKACKEVLDRAPAFREGADTRDCRPSYLRRS
jgi:hypothetical protein